MERESDKVLRCPRCKTDWNSAASGTVDCPMCGVAYEVLVFDALNHAPVAGSSVAEAVVAGDEAGCFYHPEKKAVVPCDVCGRFLCALCDMEVGAKHFCPACLEKGRTSRSLPQVVNYRTSYPDIALTLSLVPILFWPITILTAPAAIYFGIAGWNKPPSLTGQKKRLRTVFAIVFSAMQLAGWIALIVAIFIEVFRSR